MVKVFAAGSKATRILKSESPSNRAGVVQGLEAQLVAGVGRVGNQLPEEDLAVGIQRVDHQLQQLLDLGLEAEGFFGCGDGGVGHG
jgi:hypothetical protein